jgi:hypothetical protein
MSDSITYDFDEKDFVYPLQLTLPTTFPYSTERWEGFLPEFNFFKKDWDEWIPYRDLVVEKIHTTLDRNECLPLGTKLYHGSIRSDLDFKKDTVTFFSLDVVMALWRTLEYQAYLDGPRYFGVLYEFEVVKPLPVFAVLSNMFDAIEDSPKCKDDHVCIHPQVTFHDFVKEPPYDMGIEVSMNLKYYRDYIKLQKQYLVDTNLLLKHAESGDSFDEFNPSSAIFKKKPNYLVQNRGGLLKLN